MSKGDREYRVNLWWKVDFYISCHVHGQSGQGRAVGLQGGAIHLKDKWPLLLFCQG